MKITSRTRKYDRVFDIKGLTVSELIFIQSLLKDDIVGLTFGEYEKRKEIIEKIRQILSN